MMRKLHSFLAVMYHHHFIRYVFVGGSTFILDFSILFIMHEVFNLSLPLATTIAYWVSIIYNFSLNRWWTFSASENEKLHKHATAYLILLGFNYLFTVIFVSLVSQLIYFGLAKVLAVAIQISWTYYLYKNLIFVTNPSFKRLKKSDGNSKWLI